MIWAAILISLAALVWLAWRDPKRRRVFRLPRLARDWPAWPGWLAFALPGLVLLMTRPAADLVIWMGAVCAFGWMLVAVGPDTWRGLVHDLDRAGNRFESMIRRKL